MDLAKADDVIQALPSKRADEPLHVCVLPRRPRRRDHLLDAEDLQHATTPSAIDPVSIPHEIPRRRLLGVLGEGLHHLWQNGVAERFVGTFVGSCSTTSLCSTSTIFPPARLFHRPLQSGPDPSRPQERLSGRPTSRTASRRIDIQRRVGTLLDQAPARSKRAHSSFTSVRAHLLAHGRHSCRKGNVSNCNSHKPQASSLDWWAASKSRHRLSSIA